MTQKATAVRALGIDFGTTTTLVGSRVGNGLGASIPIGRGERWMPSLAAVVDGKGELRLGEDAVGLASGSVVRSVKSRLVAGDKHVELSPPGGPTVDVEVDVVIRELLRSALHRIEVAGSRAADFDTVRLGCPAMWAAAPRERLARIAQSVGLDVTVNDLTDEPIAAGVSWIGDLTATGSRPPEGRVLVFDYGGGTLDVAVLRVDADTSTEVTVLGADGTDQGGDVLDEKIVDRLSGELRGVGYDIDERVPFGRDLLRVASARLKTQLSVDLDASTHLPGAPDAPLLEMSRSMLEEIFRPQLDDAIRTAMSVVRSAGLRERGALVDSVRSRSDDDVAASIDFVLLAGGMSRVPFVETALRERFPSAELVLPGPDRDLEERIVEGLTYSDIVSRMNLHRPALDFVLESGDETQLLYEAFTPLYTRAEVWRGQRDLGKRREVRVAGGTARLTCRTPDGTHLPLYVDGRTVDGLEVGPRNGKVALKLYVDGRVTIGGDRVYKFRVHRWPVLRGTGSTGRVELETDAPSGHSDWNDAGWWTGGE